MVSNPGVIVARDCHCVIVGAAAVKLRRVGPSVDRSWSCGAAVRRPTNHGQAVRRSEKLARNSAIRADVAMVRVLLSLSTAMSTPRQVLPGQFYMITRRCTQRQFLLRPDRATNNAFIYCLAVAARKYEIEVLISVAESNHHHTVIFDRYGRCPQFVENFHKLFARSQNALRGRWENFWAAEEPCITRLLDREAVVDKLVYAATNPVKDHLVERVHHWPGVNTYRNLISGRTLAVERPRHFFRSSGPMPESVELAMTVPVELGGYDIIDEVRARVQLVEQAVAEERRRVGFRLVGRRAVLRQSWKDSPQTVEPRRRLRPRFAGAAKVRVAALACYRQFVAAYRDARVRWLDRQPATFPIGTYWLLRFAAVSVPSA
jgi:putative transposase